MSQRLVRLICRECKEVDPNPDRRLLALVGLRDLNLHEHPIYRGRGCKACSGTGYRGRKGIFEMMIMNNELRDLAFRRATATELRRAAKASGMRNLLADGKLKILNGITTPKEVARFAQEEGVVVEEEETV